MTDLLLNLQTTFRWVDLVDVSIVAFLIYRLLMLVRGTRAMQMLTGLGILAVGYFVSSAFELFTTHWVLAYFFDYLIIIVIVLFQDDLRRALTTVGRNPFVAGSEYMQDLFVIDEVSRAASEMARHKVGALIVIERETGLKDYIDTGSPLDSFVRSELLMSIFMKDAPMHDGAVVIRSGRLAAAGCFLPLSKDVNLDRNFGSRHRAAFGLSEVSDAIVVVVSEERGEAHIVTDGRIFKNLSEDELRLHMRSILGVEVQKPRRLRRMRALFK